MFSHITVNGRKGKKEVTLKKEMNSIAVLWTLLRDRLTRMPVPKEQHGKSLPYIL